jgi:hypothetical protein
MHTQQQLSRALFGNSVSFRPLEFYLMDKRFNNSLQPVELERQSESYSVKQCAGTSKYPEVARPRIPK